MSSIKKETDVYFYPAAFSTPQEKIAFFEERGMHVELVPFYTEETQLNMLHGFDAEGQVRMKQLMQSCHIWKMTAADVKTEIHTQTASALEISWEHNGDLLKVHLNGRLDTLSAPELMKLLDAFDENASVKELSFDLENLEYLSSTGLRILLMMAERFGSDHLYIMNANASVRNVFETTGFSKAVTIK